MELTLVYFSEQSGGCRIAGTGLKHYRLGEQPDTERPSEEGDFDALLLSPLCPLK